MAPMPSFTHGACPVDGSSPTWAIRLNAHLAQRGRGRSSRGRVWAGDSERGFSGYRQRGIMFVPASPCALRALRRRCGSPGIRDADSCIERSWPSQAPTIFDTCFCRRHFSPSAQVLRRDADGGEERREHRLDVGLPSPEWSHWRDSGRPIGLGIAYERLERVFEASSAPA